MAGDESKAPSGLRRSPRACGGGGGGGGDSNSTTNTQMPTTAWQQQQQLVLAAAAAALLCYAWHRRRRRALPLLHHRGLRSLAPCTFAPLASLTRLDLSHNELSELSGLASLAQLAHLDLSRNWFKRLPPELVHLKGLEELNASRNFLRPNPTSLALPSLQQLERLRHLDLRFNRKCDRQGVVDMVTAALPEVALKVTISWPAPEGSFVGDSPAERDPSLLRSQLEPWPTFVLRQRLVDDFGQPPTDAEEVLRPEVMQRLLACYLRESAGRRRLVRIDGIRVSEPMQHALLDELRAWSRAHQTGNKERPSIRAEGYMILKRLESLPLPPPPRGKAKPAQAAQQLPSDRHKAEEWSHLWRLAAAAMEEVDPEFASRYNQLAVTTGFRGSPHIDKQNTGPFYGLALGDFSEGTGGIRVELTARTVAEVNTKGRLGKVDGRFPHWVAPYDPAEERYSLIFYATEGEVMPKGAAVFPVPPRDAEAVEMV